MVSIETRWSRSLEFLPESHRLSSMEVANKTSVPVYHLLYNGSIAFKQTMPSLMQYSWFLYSVFACSAEQLL